MTSNKCQYLHQYWLFLWRFFWYVPIRHIGSHLECQNTNKMCQSTTNEIGVLTACNSEQPYLHQNKIFLWRFFWFGIIHNKDKHWEGLNRGSLGKIKWNDSFSWHLNMSTIVSVSCSDTNHETENYTLITRAIWFQTPQMTLYYHMKSESKNAPQKDLVLAEIWLLTVADSEHTNFIFGWLVHPICTLTLQMPSYMPNGDIPKKAPQK